MPELLLALDAGTTGTRAMLVASDGAVLAVERRALRSSHPAPGLVEQDAEEVWRDCEAVIAGVLTGRSMADVAAIGVTTQRASVVLWDAATGDAVAPMLVWSDLRGAAAAKALKAAGFVSWPQVPSAKLAAAIALAGRDPTQLRWGTLDSWLVHRLSGGSAHVTDLSNAWLTGYLDFATTTGWNEALLAYQRLPATMFPRLTDSWGTIARTRGGVPIAAVLADQQAGMVAHGALAAGAWKATYGTSAVVMVATGDTPASPHPTMPPEALYRAGGTTRFCVEGMVVSAGSLLEWLCGLGLFADVPALVPAAASAECNGVHCRPSLAGLGAPHGDFAARGLLTGLSFAAGRGDIAHAALTGIAYRVREIVAAMDPLTLPEALPVDGGLARSDLFLQLQADTLQRPVRRHAVTEGTAYGAALAAGVGVGLLVEADLPALATYGRAFEPAIGKDQADAAFAAWSAAVMAV